MLSGVFLSVLFDASTLISTSAIAGSSEKGKDLETEIKINEEIKTIGRTTTLI
jgi:hypothetical protein